MIYSHWTLMPWEQGRWPDFLPSEFSSPDNGQVYYWPDFFDRLQRARTEINRPVRINSAHRSWRHNLAVGGAPKSQHRKLAVDIALCGHDRFALATACKAAGFTGFGYYQTFLHVDLGRPRFWFGGAVSKRIWAEKDIGQ